ncbi:hypothetical protein MIND_00783500 [Mycena indigotica]|uniref:Uncharacterized protein n=1 Tax=Mycena indigotica TaxID=2126181 RepID=A0A8H6SML3_9AGAR|nr:uncharacterized protein MIND_00783500 [Mycena indigotica]KAF7302166.1 hypothetical protein MIND_00783500 [Mycena indigotica]
MSPPMPLHKSATSSSLRPILAVFSALTLAPPPPALSLVLGVNGLLEVSPPPLPTGASALLREVPDVLVFAECWAVFTAILQNEHLELPVTQGLNIYLCNVITIAKAYSWASVLDYHVAFVQKRMADPFFNPVLWAESDPHLHTSHLLAPSLLAIPVPIATPSASSSPTAAAPARARPAGAAAEICFRYNNSGCNGESVGCLRRHVCGKCGGLHPQPLCTVPQPAAGVGGDTA